MPRTRFIPPCAIVACITSGLQPGKFDGENSVQHLPGDEGHDASLSGVSPSHVGGGVVPPLLGEQEGLVEERCRATAATPRR